MALRHPLLYHSLACFVPRMNPDESSSCHDYWQSAFCIVQRRFPISVFLGGQSSTDNQNMLRQHRHPSRYPSDLCRNPWDCEKGVIRNYPMEKHRHLHKTATSVPSTAMCTKQSPAVLYAQGACFCQSDDWDEINLEDCWALSVARNTWEGQQMETKWSRMALAPSSTSINLSQVSFWDFLTSMLTCEKQESMWYRNHHNHGICTTTSECLLHTGSHAASALDLNDFVNAEPKTIET